MPISVKDAVELPKVRPPRSKVDWPMVITQILDAEEYFSAREIQETFVEKKVEIFRTKVVLDKAHEEGILGRRWHGNMWIYGMPIEEEES